MFAEEEFSLEFFDRNGEWEETVYFLDEEGATEAFLFYIDDPKSAERYDSIDLDVYNWTDMQRETIMSHKF